MHWHPNADEWQYYVKGTAQMTVFGAGPKAVTSNFNPGDIGYIDRSNGHYVRNTGDTDLVFLEVVQRQPVSVRVAVGLARPLPASHGRSPLQHAAPGHRQAPQQRARRDAGLSHLAPHRGLLMPTRPGRVLPPRPMVCWAWFVLLLVAWACHAGAQPAPAPLAGGSNLLGDLGRPAPGAGRLRCLVRLAGHQRGVRQPGRRSTPRRHVRWAGRAGPGRETWRKPSASRAASSTPAHW